MAKLFLIDVEKNETKIVQCKELDDYYKHLGCRCFDIARRKVGKKIYDIYVDDEGLFRDDPIISAIDKIGNPMLVGNLIFANHDSAGNTTSLTENDVENIKSSLVKVFTMNRPSGYTAVMCEY